MCAFSVLRNTTIPRLSACDSSAPSAAPATANSRLSASNCRIKRPREAPSDSRTPISRSRALARASIRFARFAQAISKTNPAIASSVHSGFSYSRRRFENPFSAENAAKRYSMYFFTLSGL